jgi:hypothetical protein
VRLEDGPWELDFNYDPPPHLRDSSRVNSASSQNWRVRSGSSRSDNEESVISQPAYTNFLDSSSKVEQSEAVSSHLRLTRERRLISTNHLAVQVY